MTFEVWIDNAELPKQEDEPELVDFDRATALVQHKLVGWFPSVDVEIKYPVE